MPVVDASVVVDWIAPDSDSNGPAARYARELARSGQSLIAPRLLFEEVGNALLTGVRRSRWNGTDADRMFAVVRRMPVRLVDDDRDIDRAWELSRRYDEHPLYDMVYVAVAERLGETFVTADAQLLIRLQQLPYVVGLGQPADSAE